MEQAPYADDPFLFYPGARLSAEERRRMDTYDIRIEDVTVDHLVYAMSKQIERNFQTFYSVAEDIVGEEQALKIAHEIGRRYGGSGYEMLLEAMGSPGSGSARHMALYQDLVHSIRGPKHASALYAEYDENRCVVKRRECIYFDETRPANGKYTGAFESGCFEGYCSADENLLRVEVHHCRWRGDDACEQHWVYWETPGDPAIPEDSVAREARA